MGVLNQEAASRDRRLRILILSRSYPSRAFPTLGLWVRRMVSVASRDADCHVVCPVPYAPPLVLSSHFDRYRRIERRRTDEDGTPVEYPRIPTGPGYLTHSLDAALSYLPVRRIVGKLHRRRPFDVLHAHFIYPEGVVAARLGKRYGIPVITTEHALWEPWLDRYAAVRRQVLACLPDIRLVTVVSEAVRRSVESVAGPDRVGTQWLPNVLDEAVFTPGEAESRVRNRLLFVGAVRHVKGLDVAVRAVARLRDLPGIHLRVVGEPFRRSYVRDERRVRDLARELAVADRVEFVGALPPESVAEEMRKARLLVVPSRRESFSSVTVEALACGTPVVATRCGGPEEILSSETGVLVPPDDPLALAGALRSVLEGRRVFAPERLRRHVVERYGTEAARRRLREVYSGAVAGA